MPNDQVTDEQFVKAKYPDAIAVKKAYYGWAIMRHKTLAMLSGNWGREEYAWHDAAERIRKQEGA